MSGAALLPMPFLAPVLLSATARLLLGRIDPERPMPGYLRDADAKPPAARP